MILDLSKATASTMPSWPLRVMVQSPVVRSVTVIVPSVLHDTTFWRARGGGGHLPKVKMKASGGWRGLLESSSASCPARRLGLAARCVLFAEAEQA